jgi:hypothetical protein
MQPVGAVKVIDPLLALANAKMSGNDNRERLPQGEGLSIIVGIHRFRPLSACFSL